MQSAAAFLGGAVVGTVLSAACGFDLFREEERDGSRDGSGEVRARGEEDLEQTKALLSKAKDLLASADERSRTLSSSVKDLEKENARLRENAKIGVAEREKELRRVAESSAASRVAAERFRGDLEKLQVQLASANHASRASAHELEQWKTAINRQALRFFARERCVEDAPFASEYLASPGSRDEKRALLLELIQRNKTMLLSLSHEPFEARDAALEEGGGGVSRAAAAQDSGGLAPAASNVESAARERPKAESDP